jgi:hypothetical protein
MTYTPEPPPVVRSRPPVSSTPNPPAAKHAKPPSTPVPSPAPSATGMALPEPSAPQLLAAIGLLLIIMAVIVLANQSSNTGTTTSRSSSTISTYRSSSTTPSAPPLTPEEATNQVIRAAYAGQCIHRTMGTQQQPDGSYAVTVTSAGCGTSYSTHRIVLRTSSITDCGPNAWVRNGDTPQVVLCLEPNSGG